MRKMVGSSSVSTGKAIGFLLCGVVAILLAVVPASGQQPPIKIAIVEDLTGALSGPGTFMKDGALLAVSEINAKGGILGRKIETGAYDTQSDPPTGIAVMRRALNDKPLAVIGPVFSSTTVANMYLAQEAGVPQFIGAEAAVITQKGNPYVFRTSFTQSISMAKMAKWMADDLKADKVAVIWGNDAYGKGGWDTFNKEWQARGKSVLINIPTENGQVDFTAELTKVKNSGATTLFIYIHEEECARLMAQLRKMGLQFDHIVGETNLCTQQTIELAKKDLDGVQCHVGLTADAPKMRPVAEKFFAQTKQVADHNTIKGYLAPYMVKYAAEATGGFDQAKFRSCLHGLYMEAAKEPGMLQDTYMDDNGDIDRDSFIVEVKDGKALVIKTLAMLRTDYPRKSCK